MKATRRKFIKSILGVGVVGSIFSFLYPVISYLVPPKVPTINVNSVNAGKFLALKKGSYKILKFGREPVILIKDKENNLHALNATCTHLDCIVQYKKDTNLIWCACHKGIYDLNGKNVSGPPPKPLKEFSIKLIDDEIIVSKQKA